jgi:tRNA-dihydrouridine synthase B
VQIGNLTLQNPVILAPMAGYTNLPFRLLMKEHGCGLVTSEMVSAVGLSRGDKRSNTYLRTRPVEAPFSIQIFGADPLVMARAAAIAQRNGADIVDINMGCPVKKVVKTGAGAALLRDMINMKLLLNEVRKAITCPLTIKIRSGWSSHEIVAEDVALLAQDMGVDAVTVHPRTAQAGFAGKADWDLTREICRRVSIPVIGNGDILYAHQVKDMMKYTGCSGIMIGRASMGNPWIFSQSLALLEDQRPHYPTLEERKSTIKRHFAIAKEYMPAPFYIGNMKVQTMAYMRGFPQCSEIRRKLQKVHGEQEFFATLDRYFSFLKGTSDSHES